MSGWVGAVTVPAVDLVSDPQVLMQVTAEVRVMATGGPCTLRPPDLTRFPRPHPGCPAESVMTSSMVTSTLVPTNGATAVRTRSAVCSTGAPQRRARCTAQ